MSEGSRVIASGLTTGDGETILTMASAYGANGFAPGDHVRVYAPGGIMRQTSPCGVLRVLAADSRVGTVVVCSYVSCLATGDLLEHVTSHASSCGRHE